MKTIEQIRQATPLSVTSADNAIFEITSRVEAHVGTKDEGYRIIELNKGMRLRLLGCKLAEGVSPFRWGDKLDIVYVPNEYVRYVSGNLGERYKDEVES